MNRRKIVGSVKCECQFQLRGYLLIAGDWSLKVGDGRRHNHNMTDVLKGHKTIGRLNSNERIHLHEMVESNVPPRKMLTNLRKRNKKTSTAIKHVYNACHKYKQSIRGTRTDMQHLLKLLVENDYVYHCRNYPDSDDISDIFWRIQMVSSSLAHSLRCLCWIPLIRPTSTVFRCLSLLVTLLPS